MKLSNKSFIFGNKFHPAQIIFFSFISVIVIGALLLKIPQATTSSEPISFIDALFTATSATCVTGLIVVDTGTYFTSLGQVIIIVLVQLGGLGIMMFSAFFAMFFKQGISIKERVVLREMMNVENIGMINKTIRNIFVITFSLEIIGTVLLIIAWSDCNWGMRKLTFNSIFHSISAFCNAGFSTFSDSLMRFQTDVPTFLIFSMLIIMGGVGFITIMDLGASRILPGSKKKIPGLSLHTKLILTISGILLLAGAIAFYIFEFHRMSTTGKVLSSVFTSVTARTAGFNTVDIGQLSVNSALFLMVLMFIGASPGSTGGGIKTTTCGILWLSLSSFASGKNKIELFRKRIPDTVLNRAYIVFLFSVIVVVISVFVLTITESADFIDILFEEISAFGTVGLSRGLTPDLTGIGKVIITISMFVGRIGPLTLASAIINQREPQKIEYPSEYVMIG